MARRDHFQRLQAKSLTERRLCLEACATARPKACILIEGYPFLPLQSFSSVQGQASRKISTSTALYEHVAFKSRAVGDDVQRITGCPRSKACSTYTFVAEGQLFKMEKEGGDPSCSDFNHAMDIEEVRADHVSWTAATSNS